MSIDERDEQGRIKKKTLTSEEAKRLAARRWAAPVAANMTDLAGLAGFDSPDDMPAHLRLFAEEFASGGPRSVQAGIQYVKATGLLRRDTEVDEGLVSVSSLSPFLQNVIRNKSLARLLELVVTSPALLKMLVDERTKRAIGRHMAETDLPLVD